MDTLGLGPLENTDRGAVGRGTLRAPTAEPELDRLCEAGLVEVDDAGGWRLTLLGEAAMARFYKHVEGSPFWRV